jgi:hypothetical protein
MDSKQIAHGLALILNGALHTMRLMKRAGFDNAQLMSQIQQANSEERDLSAAEVERALASSQDAINALREAQEEVARRAATSKESNLRP